MEERIKIKISKPRFIFSWVWNSFFCCCRSYVNVHSLVVISFSASTKKYVFINLQCHCLIWILFMNKLNCHLLGFYFHFRWLINWPLPALITFMNEAIGMSIHYNDTCHVNHFITHNWRTKIDQNHKTCYRFLKRTSVDRTCWSRQMRNMIL